MSAAVLAALTRISTTLAGAGVPPLSDYWRAECKRFYEHPSARLLVECVGRGGDKSRTATMMAIAEVLAGDFHVPPGERHYFVHVSENRDEASKTLGVLEAYLRTLRIPFTRSADTIEFRDMPRGVKVLACRVGAVSGFRCIGWTADECAKWSDDGADPSEEVIASIRAMTVTHPAARGRMISSPLATLGHFYEAWHAGDTPDQLTGHATSWDANPSITLEQTLKLERDPRKHAREYGAVPVEGSEEAMFDAELLDRATRELPGDVPPERGARYLAAMDPSLGRNAWTLAIAGMRGRKASIVLAREWRAPRGTTLDPAAVLEQVASKCALYGVTHLYTDQFHGESLASIASRMKLGITVVVDKPTATERLERYESFLTRLMDNGVELPRDRVVRSDLLAVRRRITAGANAFTISMAVTADGRHADFAPSITLVCSRLPRDVAAAISLNARVEALAGLFSGEMFDEAAQRLRAVEAARTPEYMEREREQKLDGLAAWDALLKSGGVDVDDLEDWNWRAEWRSKER